MRSQKTQDDIVRDELGYQPTEEVRKVRLPGIESLHQRPINEIGEVLANVLRMEANVKEMRFVVGKYIELTIDRS